MTSAWDVQVNVTLTKEDPIEFSIDSPDLPKDKDGNLIFNNNKHAGFHIRFVFTDKTGLGYLWPPQTDKDEAVWSEVGNICPGPPGKRDVFHPTGVDMPARTVLRVTNPNPSPAQGKFTYTLRVTKDNGTHYLPLDPGGVNENGSYSSFNINAAFIAVGAVVLVAFGLYELGVFGS